MREKVAAAVVSAVSVSTTNPRRINPIGRVAPRAMEALIEMFSGAAPEAAVRAAWFRALRDRPDASAETLAAAAVESLMDWPGAGAGPGAAAARSPLVARASPTAASASSPAPPLPAEARRSAVSDSPAEFFRKRRRDLLGDVCEGRRHVGPLVVDDSAVANPVELAAASNLRDALNQYRQRSHSDWMRRRAPRVRGLQDLPGDAHGPDSGRDSRLRPRSIADLSQPEIVGRHCLDRTNAYRGSRGLPPLRWNPNIFAICAEHAIDMCAGRAPFSHAGFSDRARRFGFRWLGVGENLAWNEGFSWYVV